MTDRDEPKTAKRSAGASVGQAAAVDRIGDSQRREIVRYAHEHQLHFAEAAARLGISDKDGGGSFSVQSSGASMTEVGDMDQRLFAFNEPNSIAADDFRSLRNTLALRWFNHTDGARTLAVISPTRRDGRSAVAANLAVAFAQAGLSTLLIDADLRRPTLQTMFALHDSPGLVSFLAGESRDASVYDITSVPNLTVLPAGGMPPNPQELLLRGRFRDLLRLIETRYDVVIVDTPAAETGGDYKLVCAETIGALVVSRQDLTRVKDLRRIVGECRDLGIRIVGSTMTSGT